MQNSPYFHAMSVDQWFSSPIFALSAFFAVNSVHSVHCGPK